MRSALLARKKNWNQKQNDSFRGILWDSGGSVALTKEEKRKWKNRQKQSPSIKRPPAGSKTGSRWPKWNSPDCTKTWHGFIFIMGAHCFRVPEHVLIQVASALYRNKHLFYESRIFLSTSCQTALEVDFHGWVWVPSLGASTIIASVSLTHLPCLFACFYESVSCVFTFFSTCGSTYVARHSAACFGFCSVLITTFLLAFFLFSSSLIDTYVTVLIDVRSTLLICLFSFSFDISFFVINACVYVNLYTHFPPLPYSCTFIAIFICIHVSTSL